MRSFAPICIFVSALLLATTGFAQEHLTPLGGNMHLMMQPPPQKKAVKKVQSLPPDTIPFFEDFYYAYTSPYPSTRHWLDSNVYVNTGFPIAPVSIGVATFDGLNKHGYPYNFSAPVSASDGADTLTSRPINLKQLGAHIYSPADSIYLSFYYQAKGHGDPPENSDSLCLEFYKPKQKLWNKVWAVKGYNPSDSAFYYVMMPIKDTAYFDSTFQFRFRNKATTSGSLDHWHLDYIRMDKARQLHEDSTYNDLTFAYMQTPFLRNYSMIPYEQYVPSEMGDHFTNYIRSNLPMQIQNTYEFRVYNHTGAPEPGGYQYQGVQNLDPFPVGGYQHNSVHARPQILYTFPTLTDTAFFRIKHTLSITTGGSDLVHANDTSIQIQRFSNYYAYDDGTAEQAYYLNTYGALCAQRFTLNKPDTMRALDIFFDPITSNPLVINSTFNICVWTDSGNGPGTTRILRDSSMNPVFIAWGYNTIPRYVLTSPLPLNAGTYYIGFQQQANQPLNVGFDRNNNHMDALYYNVGFGWTQSALQGSLMMHPVFGRNSLVITGIKEETVSRKKTFRLYPNPAQDKVFLEMQEEKGDDVKVEVLSALGQTVLECPYSVAQNGIDISGLENGIYFIYLSAAKARSAPEKLIISR